MDFGLPLHPLIVHGAVVLIPLAALGAILVVIFPKIRTRYGLLTELFALAATAAAFGARLTGPILADDLGMGGSERIERHTTLGVWTPWPVLLLALVLPVYLWAARSKDDGGSRTPFLIAGIVTVLAAVASVVFIVLTGDSGARAVWGR